MSEKAWLDALLDGGPLPETEADAPTALIKLARLQQAFASLQWAEMDEPDPPALAGTFQWDRLTVMEPLGTGGFGEVYRALDPMLQREVALKLRRSGDEFAPAAGRAFIEEARRLAQVRHPNVLAVHGAAVDQGRAGIWADLISGETLAARLQRDGPLAAPQLLDLLMSLAAALGAVHAKQIVHGDLKPGNVMCEAGSGRFVLMDFGAGARLDARGQAVLVAGSVSFMAPEQLNAQPLGTAADLYALGATLHYAATCTTRDKTGALARLEARKDLSRSFVRLLRALLNPLPSARPDALSVVNACHELLGEPERVRRRRVRAVIAAVLVAAVIASAVALWFTIQARRAAEIERNRAVAARDFLLSMMRSPNPYQTSEPTRSLEVLFDQAVAALPAAFKHDPETEAQLLQQFGRSLIILDRDEQAVRALQRADQLQAGIGAPISASTRIQIRSYLSDAFRKIREFPRAIALTDEQASLCAGADPLPAATCVAIVNDQIEAAGFGGDPLRALDLVDQNLARVGAARLGGEYESIFVVYLQGVMRRELGQAEGALQSFIELTERTLASVPASHPGLLTDLMWLAWSASDLGDVELAQALNDYVLAGRGQLYGPVSRYTVEARLQQMLLALQANAPERAIEHARSLMAQLPRGPAFIAPFDQAAVTAALAGDLRISEAQLRSIEAGWSQALDQFAPRLAELRLNLAAIALKRGQAGLAREWLERARPAVERGNGRAHLAWYLALQSKLGPDADPEAALGLLASQHRRIHDPVAMAWLGAPPPAATSNAARIRALFERVQDKRGMLRAAVRH